jgi:hypothetical protein
MTSMHRRRALQYLGGALALPVLARMGTDDVYGAGHALHASLDMGDGAYIFRTLDTHQRRTVMAMVDQIMPETDTPGALAANVHEFADLVLTEFVEDADRQAFLQGLADLDARCAAAHGKPFDECSGAQQLAVLQGLQDEASAAPPGEMAEPFIRQAKSLTLWGYYTSEIGMTEEVHYELIPGTLPGCDVG